MEWWKYFQEAFSTDEEYWEFKCQCGREHYTTYESCWTVDPSEVCEDEDNLKMLIPERENIKVRDFPIGTFIYNGKEYAYYCDCIKHNEELMSTWEWVNRNGKGLIKLLSMVRKYNFDKNKSLLNEILDIVDYRDLNK